MTGKTGTFFSETASLRNTFTKPTDPEIHSLVTVSDLSETSCNDKPLPAPADSEATQSLNKVTEVESAEVDDTTSKVNERRKRFSRRERTFRKNRISPTVSDNPQSNEDTWADGNLTDNNRDTAHASRCVIL